MSATATQPKEIPILMSPDMVRAILDGRKTMTRRIIKDERVANCCTHQCGGKSEAVLERCPYGASGSRLWVRETWNQLHCVGNGAWIPVMKPWEASRARLVYLAGDDGQIAWHGPWRPSIHMPRWASRITLEITEVRVERLQDIGRDGRKAEDVLAEGITREAIELECKWFHSDDAPAIAFSRLWCSINGVESWADNHWVWVIGFRRVNSKTDQLTERNRR